MCIFCSNCSMKSLIPFVDVMKISDEETELLTDEKKPEQAAKVLMEKGVKLVAVTLGKDGAYIANAEGGKRVPGFESNVVDTTGAGDAFWSGFYTGLTKSYSLKDSLNLGFATSAFKLKHVGAIANLPTIEEIKDIYNI